MAGKLRGPAAVDIEIVRNSGGEQRDRFEVLLVAAASRHVASFSRDEWEGKLGEHNKRRRAGIK